MEEIGVEGLMHLRKRLRFGDIIVNHWASDRNPQRIGIFVKFKDRSLLVTDMNGNFWEPIFDREAKIEIIGSAINSNAGSTPDR